MFGMILVVTVGVGTTGFEWKVGIIPSLVSHPKDADIYLIRKKKSWDLEGVTCQVVIDTAKSEDGIVEQEASIMCKTSFYVALTTTVSCLRDDRDWSVLPKSESAHREQLIRGAMTKMADGAANLTLFLSSTKAITVWTTCVKP